MMEARDDERALNILSQRAVADLLGVSISSVQRLRVRKTGFPPRKTFGGIKGWLRKDLLAWLESAPVDEEDEGGRAGTEERVPEKAGVSGRKYVSRRKKAVKGSRMKCSAR